MNVVMTTSSVAERKRPQFWRDMVCDTFVELDCAIPSDRPFFGQIATSRCDDLNFSRVWADGQTVTRARSRLRVAREELMLVSVQLKGVGIVAQDGREARLEPGDFACYDSTRPYVLNFGSQFEQLVLHMPRHIMARRMARTEPFTARRVAGTSALGSLVAPFVVNAASIAGQVSASEAGQLAEVSLNLITMALGASTGEREGDTTAARIALAFRAKAIIDRNLHDAGLNTEKVAALAGVSTRSLQDVFHAQNLTVSDLIWSKRLEKARRDLSDPLMASASIAQIALACGFSDFAHFSRRFRAAYSASPREYRQERRRLAAPQRLHAAQEDAETE